MASVPVQLFFKRNKKYGIASDFGSITFDIILNERHNFSSNVSSHNIEDGSEISDHIRNQLENGSLSGLISNFSVKTRFLRTNRAQEAFDLFVTLWKLKTTFTVTTVLRVYKDMAITNIAVPKSFDTGEAVLFDISFRKVNQVKLKTVILETSVKVTDMGVQQNRQSAVTADQGRTVGQ